MSEAPAKSRLPIWAKLSLLIFFASMAAIIGALAVGAAWVAQLPIAARDPVEMDKVVRRFGEIETPLPKDFKYEYAFSVPWLANQCIIIEHTPDRALFWLLRIPNPSGQSSDVIVKQSAKRNPLNGKSLDVKEQGTELVAGQKMPYVIGTSGAVQEMIGAIPSSRSKKEAILFMGMNSGKAYNRDAARQLLGAIKEL